MKDIADTIAGVLVALVVLATIAVIVSGGAKTAQVIQAFGAAFGNIMSIIVKPIGGGGVGNGAPGGGDARNPFQLPGSAVPSIIGPHSGPMYG